jgi:hypothetical protein
MEKWSHMTKLIMHVCDVLSDVRDASLKNDLQSAFASSLPELQKIEQAFTSVTRLPHTKSSLYYFFHNWSMTNNSAASLSGYCNRLTMHWLKRDDADLDSSYLKALSHLNRVSDEDLGAGGGTVHFDLYYRMATMICSDDGWMSRAYLLEEGAKFKRWKDHQMLRDSDLFVGLLTTLVHEIYTHSEVEFILPLFKQWLVDRKDMSLQDQRRCLTWIVVHTAGTERNHFNETLQTIKSLSRILDKNIADYDICAIFKTYLSNKANTMDALNSCLAEQQAGFTQAVV